MKLFSPLALAALLLVPVTAAQALDVQVDVCVQARKNNSCAISQDGTHNYARGAQVGETNELEIRQRGRNNDAGAFQDGLFNDVLLEQRSRRR
jgi:curlin associated repeat protein